MISEQDSEKPLVCAIDVIGEKGVHSPWRVCSRCGNEVDGIPSKCPHCGANVLAYRDIYVRRKMVSFVEGKRHEITISSE